MSDERTQAPTQRRRQQARESGLVAHSPELTRAAGLLTIVVLLGCWGDDLALGMIDLIQGALTHPMTRLDGVDAVVEHLRDAAWRVLAPLVGIVGGAMLTMVLAHQAQVGGLWAPSRLAPDLSRLGLGWGGPDLAGATSRVAWSLCKALIVIGLGAWSFQRHARELGQLGEGGPAAVAVAASGLVLDLAWWLAVAALLIGAVDYGLVWRRVEERLRQTPDEHREELKAADGDPALRSRRRALAQRWRVDAGAALPGATLGLVGPGGVFVVLGGGPPPARVEVRHIARGATAVLVRREAERAGVPIVTAPALARHFALGRREGSVLPPRLMDELMGIWPGRSPG